MSDRDAVTTAAQTLVLDECLGADAFLVREACIQAYDGYWDAHGQKAPPPTPWLIADFVICNEGDGEMFDIFHEPARSE